MKDAKIQDAILEKFRGNKTFFWNKQNAQNEPEADNVHNEIFFKDIHADYYEVENNINFLISDGALEERFWSGEAKLVSIQLSKKGFHMISNMKEYGYVKKEKRKCYNNIVNLTILVFTILSVAIALMQKCPDNTLNTKETSQKAAVCSYCRHSNCTGHSNETNGLIGKWTISSTITRTNDSEGEGLCNVCPTITFDNNTALVTFPDNHTENYTWKTSADTLTLLSTNSQTVSTLPQFFHLKYKMEYKQEKEFLELRLSPDKDYTFVLRR